MVSERCEAGEYRSQGVGEDKAEAVRWYQKAVEQGNRDAMLLLSYAYHHGEGVPPDLDRAEELYAEFLSDFEATLGLLKES